MANRTFKVYGQAYSASGDVSVVMTVGGTEVFNGAVNDSTTVREGQPTIENHLWSYELDESITGNLAVSIAVTGGELCVGPTEYNLLKTFIISADWLATHTDWSLEDQQYMATQIGQSNLDAQKAGLYDKLMAGTANADDDGADIGNAGLIGPRSAESFAVVNDLKTNVKINGDVNHSQIVEATTDMDKLLWWPILQSGDTLTYDWAFDPDTNAF